MLHFIRYSYGIHGKLDDIKDYYTWTVFGKNAILHATLDINDIQSC